MQDPGPTRPNQRDMFHARLPDNRARGTRGFTLIEILVALAMVAILAAIAIPSYLDSVRKGRRADAVSGLSALQHAQERWRANHGSYTTDLGASGLGIGTAAPGGHYTLEVTAALREGYTATATANSTSPQNADSECRVLVLQQAGGNIRYGSGGGGSTVWGTSSPCWAR